MDTVSFLNHTSSIFVRFSWIMLLQSSLLILILLGLDVLLRQKVRAVFRYCLWMLVLVKLVLPVGLALPCSPAYYASHLLPEKVVETTLFSEIADASPVTVPAEESIPYQPVMETPTAVIPAEPVPATEAVAIEPTVVPENTPIQQPSVSLSWQTFVGLGWLIAVLVMLGLLVQRIFFVNSLIRQSKPADENLLSQLKRCDSKMGMRHQIDLRISPNATSPSVCGLVRPAILIPDNLTDQLSTGQMDAILMHELAHIKRGDLWVNLVQALLQIVYFYNPLLWVANAVIRRIREQAVDEMVLVAMDEQAQDYPETLLNVSKLIWSKPMLSLRLIGVVESKSALTGRIKHILSRPFPKSAKIGFVGLLVLFISAAVLLPMAKGNIIKDMTPEDLLEKMLEYRARVENLQFIAEYHSHSPIYGEAMAEQMIKSMKEKGVSEQQIKMMTRGLGETPEYSYQTLKCTINNLEHAKIERIGGTSDSSGNKLTNEDKNISSWDGVSGIDFNQRKGFPGSASIKDTPPIGATRQGLPWRTFTGAFADALSKAIASGETVTIKKTQDGIYRVEFENDTLMRVATIDPSQGYTCVLEEYYKQGQLSHRRTAKYQEVKKGIWFPVDGETISYSKDASVRRKSIITTSHIRINDPGFDQSCFEVDFPEGTEVRDYLQNKTYVVGSDRTYDLPESLKPSIKIDTNKDKNDATVDPNSWQQAFDAAYRLDANENFKWIAPPFIPEREHYFLNEPGRKTSNMPYHAVMRYVFHWDGKLSRKGALYGDGISRLDSVLRDVIGLGNFEYEGPSELLYIPMPGDWIVRKDASREELLIALERILFKETGREIHFEKRSVDEDVVVVQGIYQFKSLKSLPESQAVYIYTDKIDPESGAGGGNGTLYEFLKWIGSRVNMNFINQTDSTVNKMSWRNQDSSDLSRETHDETYTEKLNLLLFNLKQQTGLNFERQIGAVEKWFVIESQSPSSIPQLLRDNSTNSELKTNNYTATLPNGVTVELLGVCEYEDGKVQDYWKPDGTMLNEPIHVKYGGSYREKVFGFVFNTDRSSEITQFDAIGLSDRLGTAVVDTNDQLTELMRNLQQHVKLVKIDNLDSTDITLFITTTWQKTLKYDGKYVIDWTDPIIKIAESYETAEGAKVIFQNNYKSQEIRVQAVLTDEAAERLWQVRQPGKRDKFRIDARLSKVRRDGQMQDAATFDKLKQDDVKYYEFFMRPHPQKVTFKNISLRPGGETEEEKSEVDDQHYQQWLDKISALDDHKRAAFVVVPQLLEEPPDFALRVAQP